MVALEVQPVGGGGQHQLPLHLSHREDGPLGTHLWRSGQLIFRSNSDQPAEQAFVVPRELRAVDQPLAGISKLGLEQEHKVAEVQHCEPQTSGAWSDDDILGQLCWFSSCLDRGSMARRNRLHRCRLPPAGGCADPVPRR